MSSFVVNINTAELVRRNNRARLRALAMGIVLTLFGMVFIALGGYFTVTRITTNQVLAWLVQVFAGGLMMYFGVASLRDSRELAAKSESDLGEVAFELDRKGITMDMSRGPRLERRWGDFTLRRGVVRGRPVLHMRSPGMNPGDIQLLVLDKSYDEIADAVRRLSAGKQTIEE